MIIISDRLCETYLGGSGDHVLDEVTMAGGVDDGHIVPKDRKLIGNLKLPESN